MLDFELLVQSVKWARHEYDLALQNPEYQAMWVQHEYLAWTPCGTAACVAGHTVLEAGYQPSSVYGAYVQWQEGCPLAPDADLEVPVSELAMHLLGISYHESMQLFEGQNDIETVERVAKEIAEAHGHEWPAA